MIACMAGWRRKEHDESRVIAGMKRLVRREMVAARKSCVIRVVSKPETMIENNRAVILGSIFAAIVLTLLFILLCRGYISLHNRPRRTHLQQDQGLPE